MKQNNSFGYARIGTREQNDGPQKVTIFLRTAAHPHADVALAAQKEKVMNYCGSKGHKVVGVIAVQGSSELAMYELRRLAEDPGETELLVVVSLNRLARKKDEVLEIKALLDSSGIGIKAIDDTDAFFGITQAMLTSGTEYQDLVDNEGTALDMDEGEEFSLTM